MVRAAAILIAALACGPARAADPAKRFVHPGPDGKLMYPTDARGNRVPDFSHAGYGGGAAIPDAAVKATIEAKAGDATARIQAAIDQVAALPATENGTRGAVLLLAGKHEVHSQLKLRSGVVLRGVGPETVLVAAGTDRRALVEMRGTADRTTGTPVRLAAEYVPVGSMTVPLESTDGLKVGDAVEVEHIGTKEWIAAVGMDRFPSRDKGSYLDWRPGTVNVRWDRTIAHINGTTVTLDAPLTFAFDPAHGRGRVTPTTRRGLRNAGVENLRCVSAFDANNPRDEDHAWTGVVVEHAADVWVRRVNFAHFAGSAVAVWETSRRVTVEDCESGKPVSEVGGGRRQTFFTAGQQTLFRRCTADGGRNDFAVGHLAAGPNAFVHCKATNASSFSGPVGSWATGVLYDNVHIDGGGLALTNRETDGQGAGWAAANSVLWQCSAPVVTCRMPPTAQNWAVGVWGQFVGDGHWRQLNEFAKPDSLFAAQLAERGHIPPAHSGGFTRRAVDEVQNPAGKPAAMSLKNGWLVVGDSLLTGKRLETQWWRGSTLPDRVTEFGVGVTRFVPGRVGRGFTDDIAELAADMKANGHATLSHHWGLWYDRRRDDHQMLRRADGDVWPPFLEQPWARSGRGTAWDGLSKYDLTKFNPWYFGRLKAFADECEKNGLVLVQQMYFQHNVLEAGAHWADFPWRPANCLQDTGFPEPPEYAGGKRVFMAEAFYDVTHPVRRDLHRRYIRHCLDVLGGCPNVVFQTGEEFTGPLEFVRFWLDTIAEWRRDTGNTVLVGLSATKDVQDAILADSVRSKLVGVIDIKYWWPTADGGVFDPKGGENLAPRQQVREWKGSKSRSDSATAKAVREYRVRFPDKAVTVSLDGADGWAIAAAGGSVPALAGVPEKLRAALPRMTPFTPKGLPAGALALADAGRDYLIWCPTGVPAELTFLPGGAFAMTRLGNKGCVAWVSRTD